LALIEKRKDVGKKPLKSVMDRGSSILEGYLHGIGKVSIGFRDYDGLVLRLFKTATETPQI
jgi:hypothetical protein